jgi:hypothetical protein
MIYTPSFPRERAFKKIAGSYPEKRVSKNDASIITYPHSGDKHLENSPTRHPREGFVKIFWPASEICHMKRTIFDSAR